MTKDEALKMALVALFTYEEDWKEDGDGGVWHAVSYDNKKIFSAIDAIREALAQPEQEPVEIKQIAEALRQVGLTLVHADGSFRVMDLGCIEAQTTSIPASKPWVGLTDDERSELLDKYYFDDPSDAFMREFEDKLKEKNT